MTDDAKPWDEAKLRALREKAAAQQQMQMFGPLELLASRWAFLFIPAVLGLSALIALELGKSREEGEAQFRRAQELWFTECSKPIDECAVAWDDSYTLRRIYFDRSATPTP